MLAGMDVLPRRGFLLASAAAAANVAIRLSAQQVSRESLVDDVVTANHVLAAQEIFDASAPMSCPSCIATRLR